jgi:biopolymer transport protein ExbB/TolQ
MAENVFNMTDVSVELIHTVGNMALWLQGLGIIIVLWIVFQLVSLYLNRKKVKEIYKIKDDIKRIEGKIDKIIKKKN